MILRVIRARFAVRDVGSVLDLLRAQMPTSEGWPGIVTWTHGIRREGDEATGMTVSMWTDFDAIRAVAGGRTDRDLSEVAASGLLQLVGIDHFEVVEPVDSGPVMFDGAVLGVIRGLIQPGAEPEVHELIRGVRDQVIAAGVVALHVGRRVVSGTSELIVVAIWRDRMSMRTFLQGRRTAIDPRFTGRLTNWRFETFDSITPARLREGVSGPAELVVDAAGICIDATPAVEAVLGMPGELLLRHPLSERSAGADDLAPILVQLNAGEQAEGRWSVVRIDGAQVTVTVRGQPNVPEPGLHTLVLERASDDVGGAEGGT